jgi:hypothetical protein
VQPLPIAPIATVAPLPPFEHVCVYSPAPPEDPLPEEIIRSQLYLGIDFGQAQDYTAFAILEKSWVFVGPRNHWDYQRRREERFAVRHLERLPLGTPYTAVVARIAQIARPLDRLHTLLISADATGVGAPVIEQIRQMQLGRRLHPVIITPGNTESEHGIFYHVPKSHLITNLILQFESGMFKVSSNLPLAPTLLQELGGLRIKVSTAGNDIYSTWRADQHDDLLFAVALANWQAQRDKWSEPQRRLYW